VLTDVTLLYGTETECKNRKTLVAVIQTAEIKFLRNTKKYTILYKIKIICTQELCFIGT
jgi:hypothetical protein